MTVKAAAPEKSKTTTPAVRRQAANTAFFKASGEGGFFSSAGPSVQMKMAVSQPDDKLEKEADKTASRVMKMPASASAEKEEKLRRKLFAKTEDEDKKKIRRAPAEKEEKLNRKLDENKADEDKKKIQRAPDDKEKLQRAGTGSPAVSDGVHSAIQSNTAGGQPLSADVRGFMEPRFSADFSNVRIHNDAESARLSNNLGARAFTYRNHIFFSRDQYQPGSSDGRSLLAHELTHTVQQGHAVQRAPQVTTTPTQPHVQRSVIGEILDWIADKANIIPGFRMFTVILGVNPINMQSVDRSAANILRALIEFMPGGGFITQALDNYGVFDKIGNWIEGKIKAMGMVGSTFSSALRRFLDSLGLSDLAPWNWGDVWNRAKRIFTEPVGKLIDFAKGVVVDILKFVKDVILKPLAALAQGTRGYDLLKAILGQDPITGEPVPRNADTLIGGFMKLIGQEEIWENIKKGNAIARAWAWFQGALSGLMGFVRSIPRKIIDTITSLTFMDIVTIAGAFRKIVGAFVNIAVDFISWGLDQVISLLEILFSVVAPGVMPYITKARTAFVTIIKNPIGFIGNLVRAGKMGFELFKNNFVEHLKNALIKWLLGPLAEAGVYIPKTFNLLEIIKLVLSVLGLTWQNIRSKLVKIIPEPVLVGLEKTASILVTLVKDGPAAAWEQIKAELTELKDQLISQIVQMVTTEVVKAAVVKLVSMLNPAGAVIQAIIAIYNTIMFFIEKARQIAAVVASFIDSISAIAAGQVAPAAKKVEQTMANTLTVVIAFLARFIGLGGVPAKIVGIVKKIRAPIDKGLDKIVAWLGKMLGKIKSAISEWWKTKVKFSAGGEDHHVVVEGGEDNPKVMVKSTLSTYLEYIKNAPDTDANKPKKAAAKDKAEKIEARAKPTTTEAEKAKQAEDKRKLINELAVLMGELAGDEEVPVSQVAYGGVTPEGGATEMTANPLSSKHLEGSTADTNVPIYQALGGLRKGQGPPYYIQGHLLNRKLGGPGLRFNLTPITTSANGNHSNKVENVIKGWFKAPVKAKAVYYHVKPDGYDNKQTLTPTATPAERIAEKRLVNYFSCEAYVLEKKGGKWEKAARQPAEKIASQIDNK